MTLGVLMMGSALKMVFAVTVPVRVLRIRHASMSVHKTQKMMLIMMAFALGKTLAHIVPLIP
jgi:hypothetical protein